MDVSNWIGFYHFGLRDKEKEYVEVDTDGLCREGRFRYVDRC
jgi:hypothetical protein